MHYEVKCRIQIFSYYAQHCWKRGLTVTTPWVLGALILNHRKFIIKQERIIWKS